MNSVFSKTYLMNFVITTTAYIFSAVITACQASVSLSLCHQYLEKISYARKIFALAQPVHSQVNATMSAIEDLL